VRVLVSGYYGFGNLGDEALLSGMLSGLRTREVTVLSQRPAETRALHGVASTHRLTGLAAIARHDALISGGGGLLQDRTSARSLRYYLGVIALARRLGKRVIVFGQSVGPLSPAGERRVARALRGVPVAVRDGPSQRLLGRLGIPAALVADTALLLPKPVAGPGADAPVLLVPRGGYPEITGALGGLAERLHAEGVPLAGLALHPSEDEGALEQLARHAPLEHLDAATFQQALEHLAGARHVVSARLHGLILAARAGRPYSGVAYDPKVAAFLSESGLRIHPATPDPAALLEDVLHAPFDAAKVSTLEARARDGLRWLTDTLNPR
jgi:polysaccharide pyruvyl transferase CsaB